MRTNCAERNLILESTTGELKLSAGKFWNIQKVEVSFNANLKSGKPSDDDITYIIERMEHCPVSSNIPDDIDKKSSVIFN